jgi:diguanylate cyclase (GGDEF)-like protein
MAQKTSVHDLQDIVDVIDYHYQPIVNINTGVCFGVEALIRNTAALGYSSIQDFFNDAHSKGTLYDLDILLRKKAIEIFAPLKVNGIKLFYNLDNRILVQSGYSEGNTASILEELKMLNESICFELSEQYRALTVEQELTILEHYKTQNFKIAIDDFGTGYSGLQLLYQAEPDYLKIDRFFINGIADDSRKKLFVANVLGLSHTLGIQVIAEGIETEKEFLVCREIGCDMVQGYLVQKPVPVGDIVASYRNVAEICENDKRSRRKDLTLIQDEIEYIIPIQVPEMGLQDFFEIQSRNKQYSLFPVVNSSHEPIGFIHERDMKSYVYKNYGRELLHNPAFRKTLMDFITSAPVADIHVDIEKILQIFSVDTNEEGIIITENGKYAGFLSAKSLINILHEKNLAFARDLNPLTKLPGNSIITEFIQNGITDGYGRIDECLLVYFDFNDFKPFNDTYGFRLGDRAILIFSDILKIHVNEHSFFAGHIGGDDFFIGGKIASGEKESVMLMIADISRKFAESVVNLYDDEDRNRGWYLAQDRDGSSVRINLLTVSAAIMHFPGMQGSVNTNKMGRLAAKLKKKAKKSPDNIYSETITEDSVIIVKPWKV